MGTDSTGSPVLRLGSSAPALEAALAHLTDKYHIEVDLASQGTSPAHGGASMCPRSLRAQLSARALMVARRQLHVVTVLADDEGLTSDGLTWLVASAAQWSAHPAAQAIVHFAREHGQKLAQPTHFEALPQYGYGVRATVDGRVVLIGNRELMRDEGVDPGTLEQRAAELEGTGRSVVYVALDGLKAGATVIADGG
jgi:hypothetical protein